MTDHSLKFLTCSYTTRSPSYRRLHTLSTHLHTFDRTRTLSWSSQSLVAFHRITRKVSSSMQRMQCTQINDRNLSLTHDNTWHNVSDRSVTIEGNGIESKWKKFTSATEHSLANKCSLMSMQLRQKECQHPCKCFDHFASVLHCHGCWSKV